MQGLHLKSRPKCQRWWELINSESLWLTWEACVSVGSLCEGFYQRLASALGSLNYRWKQSFKPNFVFFFSSLIGATLSFCPSWKEQTIPLVNRLQGETVGVGRRETSVSFAFSSASAQLKVKGRISSRLPSERPAAWDEITGRRAEDETPPVTLLWLRRASREWIQLFSDSVSLQRLPPPPKTFPSSFIHVG